MNSEKRLKELEEELRDIIRDAYMHEDDAMHIDDELRELEINRANMSEEEYYEQEDKLVRESNEENNASYYAWSCAEDVASQIKEITGEDVDYELYTER